MEAELVSERDHEESLTNGKGEPVAGIGNGHDAHAANENGAAKDATAVSVDRAQIETQFRDITGIEIADDHVSFLGVTLSKGDGGERTPNLERFARNVYTDFDVRLMRDIAVAWDLNQPILLESGSGFGKTETVEFMAALLNRECYYANCHDLDAPMLIGSKSTRENTKSGFGWVDGVVTQAIRNGGILFLEEYNFMKGETRARLHDLLDGVIKGKDTVHITENDNELVSVHPDLRIVVAQNPPGGKYGDREVLDPAQFTRFIHIKLGDEMPQELRVARIHGLFPDVQQASDIRPGEFLRPPAHFRRGNLLEVPGMKEILIRFEEFGRSIEKLADERAIGEDQAQPVYFAFQRDLNRMLDFMARYYNGDVNDTMQKGLQYYYVNRFNRADDRAKVEELIQHVQYTPPASSQRIGIGDVGTTPTTVDAEFEKRGLAFLTDLRRDGHNPGLAPIVAHLGGVNTAEAWNLRRELDQTVTFSSISSFGLAGNDSREAWAFREKLDRKDFLAAKTLLIHSITGLGTDRAWEIRDRFSSDRTLLPHVVESLTGIDTDRAWKIRDHYLASNNLRDAAVAKTLAKSIAGITYRAMEIRNTIYGFNRGFTPELIESRTGENNEGAFEDREKALVAVKSSTDATFKTDMLRAISKSIAGIDTDRAWEIRDDIRALGAPAGVQALSLSGLNSERAWKMRNDLLSDNHADPSDHANLAASVFGDDTVAALVAQGKLPIWV